MTVAVSKPVTDHRPGGSIVVCEEAVGHRHRLPSGRHLPRRRRDLRRHPQDRQADRRAGRGRRGGRAAARPPTNYESVRALVAARDRATRKGRISAKRLLPKATAGGLCGVGPQLPAARRRRSAASTGRGRRSRGPAGRRSGRRVSTWSSTGVCSAGCTCSAPCWPGPGCGSCRFADNERADTTLAPARGVLRDPRRGPEGRARRPDGLPEGRGRRRRRDPDRRTTSGSRRTTGSGRTSATRRTRRARASWRTWSATPRPT